MTRTLVPGPLADDVAEAERDSYDRVVALLSQPYFAEKQDYPARDLFAALLHCPPLARHLIEIGHCFRSLGPPGSPQPIPDAVLELADLAAFAYLRDEARRAGGSYDFTRNAYNHVPRAVAAGIAPGTVAAVWDGRPDGLDEPDLEVVASARAVLAGTLDDPGFERLEGRFGRRHAVLFVTFVQFVAFVARLQGSLGCANASDAEVAALLAEMGTVDGGDAHPAPETGRSAT